MSRWLKEELELVACDGCGSTSDKVRFYRGDNIIGRSVRRCRGAHTA